MRELKTILMDLGNYNIKLTDEVKFISPYMIFDGADESEKNILEYKGVKYVMEFESDFDAEFNKVNKEYIPNMLWALHKYDIKDNEEIRLFLQLPLNNLGQAQKLKDDLLGKSFTFTTDKTREVHIKDVVVMGECMASYYMLPNNISREDLIIVDIGGRTCNVVEYKNGRVIGKDTINLGTINFYDDIKVKFNNENGENVETHQIEHYIKKQVIPQYSDVEDKFINTLINRIKNNFNIGLGKKIIFTGGGSITLRLAIERYNKNFIFMENAVFANINGAEKVAKMKGWI